MNRQVEESAAQVTPLGTASRAISRFRELFDEHRFGGKIGHEIRPRKDASVKLLKTRGLSCLRFGGDKLRIVSFSLSSARFGRRPIARVRRIEVSAVAIEVGPGLAGTYDPAVTDISGAHTRVIPAIVALPRVPRTGLAWFLQLHKVLRIVTIVSWQPENNLHVWGSRSCNNHPSFGPTGRTRRKTQSLMSFRRPKP